MKSNPNEVSANFAALVILADVIFLGWIVWQVVIR